MGIKEREATLAQRMAKHGFAVQETKSALNNDFSTSDVSNDLVAFQRQLLQEAFNEMLSRREYFIKAEDIQETKEKILDVCSEMFSRADKAVGPWEAALAYCKMRLEEAEGKELENKKKRLLANIADNYLSKVKTHQDFAEFQSLILLELGNLTAKYEEKPVCEEDLEPKINEEISRALSEAAVYLIAKPIEKQEEIVKEVVQEAVGHKNKSKTVVDIKEHNSKFYNELFKLIKNKESGKLDGDVFMKLKAEEQFGLLRIAGVTEEDLLNPKLLTENIKTLAEFIEADFQ